MNKINAALAKANGDVEAAIQILIAEKQVDANEMANRVANSKIVYSYVHNNRIGAMIILACQTDFVAKNDSFLNLAKNICMHIVATPVAPIYIDEASVPEDTKAAMMKEFAEACTGKPPQVVEKIVAGKLKKFYAERCLYNQQFVRDDVVTIGQLINGASSTLGEKIEVKHFVKLVAQ